jgi:hypothetical protein
LGSCSLFESEKSKPIDGSGDLARYIAVGNSLTAGFMDDGLYREGQLNSYPAILAQQFKLAGGGEFIQPLFSEAEANGSGYLRLSGFSAAGVPVLTRVNTNLAVRSGVPLPGGPKLTKFTDPNLQNLGVPGMSVLSSTTPLYGTLNPYYERLLADTDVLTKTYLNFISNRNHTFFSCWIGSNDVLTYATNGGEAITGNPFSGMTRTADFRDIYTSILAALTANNAKGVVATIPDFISIPFFTTIKVATVRAAAKAANPQYDVYIRTGPAPADVRVAQAEDLILLSAAGSIGRLDNIGGVSMPHGFTAANPLTDTEVLDRAEVTEITTRTTELNTVIKELATAKGVALVDMQATFKDLLPVVNGILSIYANGAAQTPTAIANSIFSLDGVHPTPRGYAIIANEFIKAINSKYGFSITPVNPADYRGIKLP